MPGQKKSTFQLILLVVFGVLAVSGILIFALAVGGNTGNAIGQVIIWGPMDRAGFSAVLRQAAESDTQFSQVSYVQKDPATYEKDLTDAIASGQGPDLFVLRQDYAYKDAGKIIPVPIGTLSESQFDNTFIEAARPFFSGNGTLGVPILSDPLILYWNKDMLATAGFAQPPQNWAQLFTMAKTLSKKNDAGSIIKSAIAMGEYKNIMNAKDIIALLIMQAGSPITAVDSGDHLVSALIAKPASTSQSTESAVRFYTEFADPSKDDYSWNRSLTNSQQAFASGDLALYIGYASEIPVIARMNPNLNFSVAPIPQIRTSSIAVGGARVYALATARGTKNPGGAITIALLLGAPDTAKMLSTATGLPVARRDVLLASLPAQNDLGKTFAPAQSQDQIINAAAVYGRSWIDPDPEATADIFRVMIEDTTSGAQLVNQAVSRADQQLGRVLGQ